MQGLNLNQIKSIYNIIKNYAQKEVKSNNYDKAIKYIEAAAELAYMFNWIYTDDDLESNLEVLSDKILIKEQISFSPIIGRVVFYDVFALDNRGLTQQYLRALISWGAEILFVFEGRNLLKSKKIIEELNSYSKAELFHVPYDLSRVEKVKCIYDKIAEFKPEKAFLHLYPSSAVAVIVWNKLKEVTRYQVNLTDHAFWLGTKCIDYSLEFRDYGCTVSYEKRTLSRNKLLIQPYYPIMDCEAFIGFPKEIPIDAIKIFTGGSYYKMYGKSGVFFELLKTLLNLSPKVVILLAGNGNETPIREFILMNKYENRLFLLGTRPDITYVFENCDIYLSTYPITGGLMGQYAACLAKPILSYSSEDIPCNFTEGFLNWNRNSDYKITHTTLDSFKAEALMLIENRSYREEKGQEIKKNVITEKEFSMHLKQLVTSNIIEKPFQKESIDYDAFCNLYIEAENKYLNRFDLLIVKHFKFGAILLFPKNVLGFIMNLANWRLFWKNIIKR